MTGNNEARKQVLASRCILEPSNQLPHPVGCTTCPALPVSTSAGMNGRCNSCWPHQKVHTHETHAAPVPCLPAHRCSQQRAPSTCSRSARNQWQTPRHTSFPSTHTSERRCYTANATPPTTVQMQSTGCNPQPQPAATNEITHSQGPKQTVRNPIAISGTLVLPTVPVIQPPASTTRRPAQPDTMSPSKPPDKQQPRPKKPAATLLRYQP